MAKLLIREDPGLLNQFQHEYPFIRYQIGEEICHLQVVLVISVNNLRVVMSRPAHLGAMGN